MHTVLDLAPFAALVVFVGLAAYRVGSHITARRITHALRTDRLVGIQVLEELAERWGVKIERQETPGGA